MTMIRRTLPAVLCAVALVVLSACGSSSDAGEAEPVVDETATEPTIDEADAGDTDTSTVDGATTTTSEAAAPAVLDQFDEIVVEPTEPGRRPTLAWAAVDGAVLYQLTVLDAAGEPYWSWSGADTSVPLGGITEVDAAGPFVFEPMTWVVVARDEADQPLAVSARQSLTP